MKSAIWLATLALLAGCAVDTSPDDVGGARASIVNGTLETGHPEVLFMYRLDGAACTASVISPRVVLIANHCVATDSTGVTAAPASYFRLYVGSSDRNFTAEYLVSEVRQNPGAGGLDMGNPTDVALLVLTQPTTITPIPISRSSPFELVGTTVTSIGFGQTPSGSSGTKYTTHTTVTGYQGGFIFVEPALCPGDSGGPLIGGNGEVYGVASFIYSPDMMSQPVCGTAPGAYCEINRHLDFIDQVLAETGTCVPTGAEVCNGMDDNCDGVVDEGCTPLGMACTDSSTCTGGLCADTDMGRLCTSHCDPLRPAQGCGPGFYCSHGGSSCDGYCVPGTAGAMPNGAACTQDSDCHSLVCIDPGNGHKQCLDPCKGDAGLCLAGEVCVADAGACGACVGQDILVGPRGLGEPCAADADCRSGACHAHDGLHTCSIACTDASTCGDGFECRDGFCILDQRQGVGGICVDDADCPHAVCAAAGGRHWCTTPCTASSCPSGFDCVAAGSVMVCAPQLSLDGEACMTSTDCVSGLCANVGSGSICTHQCDAQNHCEPGFQCQRASDGITAVCIAPAPPHMPRSGCSTSGGGTPWSASIVVLAMALLVRRRRQSA